MQNIRELGKAKGKGHTRQPYENQTHRKFFKSDDGPCTKGRIHERTGRRPNNTPHARALTKKLLRQKNSHEKSAQRNKIKEEKMRKGTVTPADWMGSAWGRARGAPQR